MKNIKVIILLAVFIGGILLAGVCLAANSHSCCAPQKEKCSMGAMQNTATSVKVKVEQPVQIKALKQKPAVARPVLIVRPRPVKTTESPPPTELYLVKLSHPALAPPTI